MGNYSELVYFVLTVKFWRKVYLKYYKAKFRRNTCLKINLYLKINV